MNGLIGKWHLGEKPHFHPSKRGFDECWGFLGGAHDYFTAKPEGEGMDGPIDCTYKTPDPLKYMTDDICQYFSFPDRSAGQKAPCHVGMALYRWHCNQGGRLETHPFARHASDALSSFR